MKNISIIALSAIVTLGTVSFDADAAPISHMYANGIVANNITVIQRSVLQTAFNNFDGTMATNIGIRSIEQEPAPKNESQEEQKLDEPETPKEDSSKTYGKMPVYGEYGDDGTVFSSGRSGGEFSILNSNWFGWQHSKDYAKFANFSKIDSRNDLVSLGIAGGHNKIDGGFSQWGIFGGIIMAQEDNSNFEIEEHGGHIGIYSGYHMHGFNVAVAGDFGTLFNSAKSAFGTDKFTNIWLGGALDASYDIALDDTFTLQPGAYLGYAWIQSGDYKSKSGDKIDNQDFNMIQFAPSLRAVKRIANNWYGALSGRYVFNFTNGGDTTVAGTQLPDLELGDYTEYGISLEKNIEQFNVSVSLNRRDGGRTGWTGELHMRYLF